MVYFDEVSLTTGFLGDPEPDVFRRFDNFDDHNYTQVHAGVAWQTTRTARIRFG